MSRHWLAITAATDAGSSQSAFRVMVLLVPSGRRGKPGALTDSQWCATLNVMVWRIHFTAEDLERIQVRPTLGPLAETVKAMGLLRCPQQPRAPYRRWRGQVKGRLTPQMAAFTAMIPPWSQGVDLSMLTGTAATLEQGVQALLTVPREQLLVEMEFTDREYKLPAAVWAAAES